MDVGERSPAAHGDDGEERRAAPPQHLLLVDERGLALGHAGLEHGEDGGHAILGDLGRPRQPPHLLRALHHAGAAEELVGGGDGGADQALFEVAPRRREEPRLVEPDAAAEDAEVAEDGGESLGGPGGGRGGPPPDLLADHARIIGVVEEELAVAGDVVDGDPVGDAGRVDEGNRDPRPAAGEDAVELDPPEEGVGDGTEAGDVVEILGGGGDEGIEVLGVEHLGQARLRVAVHGRLLT